MNFPKLQYFKCFFCMKNFNLIDLIDMNHNSVMINEENVEFRDLILDVCGISINIDKSNYSCLECNNNLVLFHMFKRDIKKYTNFNEYIVKLTILQKAENFLDSCENPSHLIIDEDPVKFSISLESEIIKEDQIIEYDYDPDEQDPPPDEPEHIESTSQYEESVDLTVVEEQEKKFSTNEDITPEQLQWIHDEVKGSEVVKGKKILYKCSVCETTLASSASLVRHLRDLHVLFDTEKWIDKKQNGLRAEISRSKVNVLSPHGLEAYWKCNRCKEDKIYRSEQGLKIHLRTQHAEEDFDEQMNVSTWLCAVKTCKEIFSSIEEVQEHVRKFHSSDEKIYKKVLNDEIKEIENVEEVVPLKKRKLNTLQDLTDKQHNWIKKQAAESEILKGRKKYYKCTLCKAELSTHASLIRHLRDIHILKSSDDEKSTLKEETTASKMDVVTSDGTEIIWKCFQCDRVYKSEQSFKLHYRMNHIRQTPVTSSLIANCKDSIIDKNQVREVWKCPMCERKFKHRDGLRGHIKSEHPNVKEIEEKIISDCNTKEKSFTQEHVLARISENSESKPGTGKGDSLCFECGLKFLTNKHHVKPKVHRDCHETFKVLAPHVPHHKCDTCRMIFNTEESLQIHLELHDDPEKIKPILINEKGLAYYGAITFKEPTGDADDVCLEEALHEAWKCGHCTSKYIEENDCVTHQMLLHSSRIFCFVDNREFDGSSGLSKYIQHMKNKHPEYFPNLTYPCGTCGIELSTIYEKLSHQKVCDKKKFTCDYCDKKYTTKHQLQSHILFELGLSGFSCEVCNKKCKTMSDLRIHHNSHTNLRPYKCSLCEKSFKTPAARSTHLEKHTLESGITCEICNVKLSNRTLYQRHKRFQHNTKFREAQYEKNFCKICNKSFLRTNHYKHHMKQHEGT